MSENTQKFFKRMNTFINLGCFKLIQNTVKYIYIMSQTAISRIKNAVFIQNLGSAKTNTNK